MPSVVDLTSEEGIARERAKKSGKLWLCVDPGETTGWSIWQGKKLVIAGQTDLWPFIDAVDAWLTNGKLADGYLLELEDGLKLKPLGAIVCEDWSLYPWMLEKLAWDKCRTARGIGALELLARQHNIPIILQGADIKEAAQQAGAEELYLAPVHENRHANDSIQHGVFYTARHGKAPA
jgi:hypothetical protein